MSEDTQTTLDLPETEQVNQEESTTQENTPSLEEHIVVEESPEDEGTSTAITETKAEEVKGGAAKAEQRSTTGKPLYTAEEMRSLDPTQIDTSRIPPEHLPFYKAMQSGYTKKYQEAAELRKQNEQPKTIQEAFDRDPFETSERIRNEIKSKRLAIVNQEAVDPFSAEVSGLKRELALLQNMRDDFDNQMIGKVRNNTAVERARVDADTAVRKAIPDFDSKVEKLTNFAVETGGFSIEEINQLIDPAVMGPMAVKMRLAINKLFDMVNAGKSADTKIVKKSPSALERPGSGGSETKAASNFSAMKDDDFETLIQKAKYGGLKVT